MRVKLEILKQCSDEDFRIQRIKLLSVIKDLLKLELKKAKDIVDTIVNTNSTYITCSQCDFEALQNFNKCVFLKEIDLQGIYLLAEKINSQEELLQLNKEYVNELINLQNTLNIAVKNLSAKIDTIVITLKEYEKSQQ